MRSIFSSILCLLLLIFYFPNQAQEIDCDFITPICSNESIDAGSPTSNPGETIITSCQNLQSTNTHWYYVRIQSGTTFTFTITPDSPLDYDFAVWKNPSDCNNLGVADRGSFAAGGGVTGLSCTASDTCEGASGDRWVRYLDVQPGDLIVIAVDRWGSSSVDYNLSFGDCGGSGGETELDCSILGDNYGVCDVDADGQEDFDLNDIEADLTDGQPSWTVDFYELESDALAGNANTESSPYTAFLANNPTELFARVEQNGNFLRVVRVFLYVNELPEITTPVDLELCDLGNDGEEEFDLTEAESQLAPGLNNFIFKYYTSEDDANAGGLNNINPANAYVSGSTIIYVRVETGALDGNEEGCFRVGQINLILTQGVESDFDFDDEYCLNSSPTLPPMSDNGISGTWMPATIDTSTVGTTTYTFTPDADECALEYEIDITIVEGITPQFTLETVFCQGITAPTLPLTSDNGIEGTWSPSIIDTSDVGTFIYTFIPDDPECNLELELEVVINNGALLNTIPAIELCDEDFDGIFEYDLALINEELITPTTGLTFEYYASQQDYLDDNPIPTTQISNYQFSLPASIWVVATTSDECRSEPVEVEFIEGQAISLLAGPYEIPFCEGESVDLTAFQNIYTSETGIIFSYYEDISNAENGSGSIITITNYIPSGVGTTIFVRIVKADGSLCPQIVEVEFIAGQEVLHNPGPFGPIEYCEDETVDITSYTTSMANESGVTLSYYNSISDAQNAINPIPDETVFDPAGNGIVYVRLEKADRCVVVLELPYEQLPSPEILSVPSQLVICEGQETIELTAESDDPNAAFQWSWGNNQAYSGATITITETGIYTLTVIGSNGCRSIQEIDVRPGGEPIITSIESGDTYLIVFAQPGGGGTLEYSLNGVLWQTSPRFDGLVKGQTYTVYVREDGCLVKSHSTVILDAPNFISPNGDGYNDLWSIRGIEATPSATIKVFDRYGKIFVDTNFEGNYIWDGKYGRRPVPSGDYWYILEVPSDGVTIPKKFVGHISVRN